jgi:hypothetical protein
MIPNIEWVSVERPERRGPRRAAWSCLVIVAALPGIVVGQPPSAGCRAPKARLLGAQATFIGQDLRPFDAAYSGPMSLTNRGDRQLSQSYGLYGGACLTPAFAAYVDVEMIRGSGISHASGLAGVTNGDVLRQGSVDLGQGPYVARAFVRWTLPLASSARDTIVAAMDEMPMMVSSRRVEITAGKFAATDIFDLNRYANSTRLQFLDWVLFNNGAWDYAADTRGYSNGITVAWINPTWSLRGGSFQMPTFANGNKFDSDIANARGDNVELTLVGPHQAMFRLLTYINHGRMGRYAVATSMAEAQGVTPDIVADDAPGRTKYGFAANAELPLADDGETGAFARVGWNDGRNESFVFTEVDRHASTGLQVAGRHWHRADDVFGVAIAADGLSGPHRDYLAAGGKGFLLGDGALRYGPEVIGEAYYSAHLAGPVTLSPDLIEVTNPGYNRDRGPAVILSARLNVRR